MFFDPCMLTPLVASGIYCCVYTSVMFLVFDLAVLIFGLK